MTTTTDTTPARTWGPLLEPLHVDLDIAPDGPSWRENAFFTFWDRSKKIYGQAHFTTSPNAGARKGRCQLAVDGRQLSVIEPLEPMSFQSESISVDLNGRVEVRCEDFGLELEVTPRFEPADYSQSDTVPSLVEGQPLQHFQASGDAVGELRFDGGAITFGGLAFRDRTWGYREDTAWLEYYGFMCAFDDFDLTFLKFLSPGDDRRARGFLMGKHRGEIVETFVTARDSIGTIKAVDLTLTDGAVIPVEFGESESPPVFVPAGNPVGGTALTIYDLFQPLRFEGDEGLGFVEQAVLRQLS